MSLDKTEQDRELLRQARLAFRQVDLVLRAQGIEAALTELEQRIGSIKSNMTIRVWIRDYKKMLDGWRNNLMPEVVDEFYTYGFRRALFAAQCNQSGLKEYRKAFYRAAVRTLDHMEERFRLSIRDEEMECPLSDDDPELMSLDDITEYDFQHGTKF